MREGYTGHLIERELLGEINKRKYKEALQKRYELPSAVFDNFELFVKETWKKISLEKSLALAKEAQPEDSDPTEPTPRFASDLYAYVAEELGLKKEDDFKKLRFYTAVRSHADQRGVDAFFELDTARETIFVTLDVTGNPRKGDGWRADVVFEWPMDGLDPKLDKEEWARKTREISDRVIYEIQTRGGK